MNNETFIRRDHLTEKSSDIQNGNQKADHRNITDKSLETNHKSHVKAVSPRSLLLCLLAAMVLLSCIKFPLYASQRPAESFASNWQVSPLDSQQQKDVDDSPASAINVPVANSSTPEQTSAPSEQPPPPTAETEPESHEDSSEDALSTAPSTEASMAAPSSPESLESELTDPSAPMIASPSTGEIPEADEISETQESSSVEVAPVPLDESSADEGANRSPSDVPPDASLEQDPDTLQTTVDSEQSSGPESVTAELLETTESLPASADESPPVENIESLQEGVDEGPSTVEAVAEPPIESAGTSTDESTVDLSITEIPTVTLPIAVSPAETSTTTVAPPPTEDESMEEALPLEVDATLGQPILHEPIQEVINTVVSPLPTPTATPTTTTTVPTPVPPTATPVIISPTRVGYNPKPIRPTRAEWRPTVAPYCPMPMPVNPHVPPLRPQPIGSGPTRVAYNPTPTQAPPTSTPTQTATNTATVAPTVTSTSAPTESPTATATMTATLTPTVTMTAEGAAPTPTATLPPSALRLEGQWVERIIGDRHSQTMYAFADGWFYRSENAGRSWMLVSSTPEVADFVMNANEPNILYSTSYRSCRDANRIEPLGPIFKSEDGGLSWIELPDTDELRPLFTYAINADIVVATDCISLYISTDGGFTWTPRPDPDTDTLWDNHVPDVVVPLYTRDAADGSIIGVEAIYAGGIARDGSGIVAFTEDLGRTWKQVTPDVFPSPWGLSTLAVDLLNPGSIWFGDAQGIWFSKDNGLSWTFSQNGLVELIENKPLNVISALTSIAVHPSNQIFLGTIDGLYAKSFEGNQWVKTSGAAFDNDEILDVFFIEAVPELLYVATNTGVHIVRISP